MTQCVRAYICVCMCCMCFFLSLYFLFFSFFFLLRKVENGLALWCTREMNRVFIWCDCHCYSNCWLSLCFYNIINLIAVLLLFGVNEFFVFDFIKTIFLSLQIKKEIIFQIDWKRFQTETYSTLFGTYSIAFCSSIIEILNMIHFCWCIYRTFYKLLARLSISLMNLNMTFSPDIKPLMGTIFNGN